MTIAQLNCFLLQLNGVVAELRLNEPRLLAQLLVCGSPSGAELADVEALVRECAQRRAVFEDLAEDLVARAYDHARFGGFRDSSVYRIDAHDPAYDNIPASGDEFAALEIDATGRTTVMVVQESPAQFTYRHVVADPTEVIRNALIVINKVLRVVNAYVPFLSGLRRELTSGDEANQPPAAPQTGSAPAAPYYPPPLFRPPPAEAPIAPPPPPPGAGAATTAPAAASGPATAPAVASAPATGPAIASAPATVPEVIAGAPAPIPLPASAPARAPAAAVYELARLLAEPRFEPLRAALRGDAPQAALEQDQALRALIDELQVRLASFQAAPLAERREPLR